MLVPERSNWSPNTRPTGGSIKVVANRTTRIEKSKRRLSSSLVAITLSYQNPFSFTFLPFTLPSEARADLTVHSLRHSFATHLYRKTRNILLVQKALDHRHITTTQIYAHIDDAELAAAVELV